MGRPKLNQIIAVTDGKKTKCKNALTKIYHMVQKEDLLKGISRYYAPHDDDGEKQPDESKNVQLTAKDAVHDARKAISELIDAVATLDTANTEARADVVLNNMVLLEAVPVTHLLFLEKQLTDLKTFVGKLPTLDPARNWHFDDVSNSYKADVERTTRSRKVRKNHVKAEADENHPAQVDVYTEDVQIGTWNTTHFSGAMPAKEKQEMVERVEALQEAVKFAREEANSAEVTKVSEGEVLLDYVFYNK